MRIYIAHNFAARIVLREVKEKLEELGHEVTSTWIWDDSHISEKNAEESAVTDLADIERADWLWLFTDQFAERSGKGKFLELGYALRAGKLICLVGEDQDSSVFYHLPNLRHAKGWEEAVWFLGGKEVVRER